MRRDSVTIVRDAHPVSVTVLGVGSARGRLRRAVGDGSAVAAAFVDLCLSIVLHRGVAQDDEGDWEDRPVLRVEPDDEVIAEAIDTLVEALGSIDELPVSALSTVLIKGSRGPDHSPMSHEATLRLVSRLDEMADSSASAASLSRFGSALLDGPNSRLQSGTPPTWGEWQSGLRWSFIDVALGHAARSLDVDAVVRLGQVIRDEVIGLRRIRTRVIRRWLTVSDTLARRQDAEHLAELGLQIRDALALRVDEAEITIFVDEMERDPVSHERARLLRDLWDFALEPPPSGAVAVLARIRREFGSTTDYERRVAGLGDRIREFATEGYEAAAQLLESELSWLEHLDLSRVAWTVPEPSAPDPAPTWAPSPIFASALRRTVLVGRALATTTDDASLAGRADALLAATLEAVRRAGGSTQLLEEGHSVWSIEQLALAAERLACEKKFEAARREWFEAAHCVHDDLLSEMLTSASRQVMWGPGHQGLHDVFQMVVCLSGVTTDRERVEVVVEMLAAARLEGPEEARLPRLSTPEGEEGGAALGVLLHDLQRFREGHHWRRFMWRWLRDYLSAERLPDLAHRDPSEVLDWLTTMNWDAERCIAWLMLGLLEDSLSGESLWELRAGGWFERSTSVDLDGDIWSQLRSPDVEEVLVLRDRAHDLLVAATGVSGGKFAPPSPERLREAAIHKPAWELYGSLVAELARKIRVRLRTRGSKRVRDRGLIPVLHSARVLLRALLAEGDLDLAADFLVRGNAVIGDLGHPFQYMSVVDALIAHDRSMDAAQLLHQLDREGAQVDLVAVTTVVSALMRTMAPRARAGAPDPDLEEYVDAIEGLAQMLGPSRADALLYSRLIGTNVMLGRLERCEEIAANARRLKIADSQLEVQLLRARMRLAPHAVEDAVEDARLHGAAQAAEFSAVVARALGGEGLIDQGLEWIERQSHDAPTRARLFEALTEGMALAGSRQGVTGELIDVETVRRIEEGMYSGDLPITRNSFAAVLGAATRVAMAGTDSDRLVVAQETRRLFAAAKTAGEASFGEDVFDQLAWLAKWTRSGKLAADAVGLADSLQLSWTSSRAGRLIEALAFSGDVEIARRLLREGLEVTRIADEQVYLYNVFLSVLRGRSHEEERRRIVEEMQSRGLELDRFSRAELGLALAAGGGFEDESRMLRGSTVEKWNELVGPLREGAKLFEPIVARLRLELRTFERALEAEKPTEVLLQRCQDVADVSKEMAETTKAFQDAVSADAQGVYSPTRYAITSDIVHELSQPTATLALQVRALQHALKDTDRSAAATVLADLLGTAQLLGRKLKSYRDSLADADSLSAAEDDVPILRAFSRAVETLDRDLLGGTRLAGIESLKRDLKYDRELVVRGSSYLLQRAFYAMLTNSLEAMQRAGTVDPIIRVEGLYHPTALVEGASYGTVQLFISDSGPGIPQEIAEEIFKAGFSTRRQRGLGLGLATVASIVQLHGGVVQLVSPANARFIIVLPAADVGRGETDGAGIREVEDEPTARPEDLQENERLRDERAGRVAGTIIQLDGERGPDAALTDPAHASVTGGWALCVGLETPVKFYTERLDVAVGVQVEMSLRQTRSGPIGTDLVVRDAHPKGQVVIGVVERVPEQNHPFGFVYVPEHSRQFVFFEDSYQGALDFDIGDPVSAILVPSFNWTRKEAGLQAIQLKRV